MKDIKKKPGMKLLPVSSPRIIRQRQRGSLTLEQALFIGAIVAMFGGVWVFYDKLGAYFEGISFSSPPSNIGSGQSGQGN